MSKYPSLQIHPGKGLGFLILGASLHDVLTRLKAQPHLYPTIDISFSPSQPLVAPVILNLPTNGFRLRFDGPDQRLRLMEILDFGKTQLSYKNIDLVKLPEEKPSSADGPEQANRQGPPFRHVYNRLMGPTFPGEYLPPKEITESQAGLYILSYPGIAFTFPLQHSAWSHKADFVSLLSSSAAAPAKSLAIFSGASWHEARQDLFTRPCLNPRSLSLSMKGKEHRPDEVDLVNVCGGGVVELLRRASSPFRIILGETTPQDLVAELGPPDAIYRKNDHRLSIHKTHRREQRMSHGSYGASPIRNDDFYDADHSSAHTTTDDSDAEDDIDPRDDDPGQSTAKCFYNYFHHGFDIFISYPSNPSPPFPNAKHPTHPSTVTKAMDHLVATKVLLHGNVPGSYPFNRYRRSRWVIDAEATGTFEGLDSETSFTTLSEELRSIWKGNYVSEQAEKATQKAIVLDRDWGDSPGSSYEVLEGWEDSEPPHKKGQSAQEGSSSGTTQIYGFPGMLFEVLKNDTDMLSPAPKLIPKSWASTLFLPRTPFPPRALVGERPKYLRRCTETLYNWQDRTRNPAQNGQFILQDGPPFANGPLHIGHALNKILKDITCRFELSLGKRVLYVPGWDCHGLPIEIKAVEQLLAERVDEGLNFKNGTIDPLEIRRAARKLAHSAFSEQKKSFQDWAIMADWDNAWKTMDQKFELRQLEVFSAMVKKGLIRRKCKPVYWSPSSRTALAEAELDYRDDHESTAAYVLYPLWLQLNGLDSLVNAVIWTTTPWTLPANRAIAVHPDLEYCIIDTSRHGNLMVAASTLDSACYFLEEDFKVTCSVLGKQLLGQLYADPFSGTNRYDRPILNAKFVSAFTGTGLVHIAPGHGMDDYELCQRCDIETFVPVDDAGHFTSDVPAPWSDALSGTAVLQGGNKAVLSKLSKDGRLLKQHPYVHRYPYDWRTKQPVIIRATEQWFADVSQIQQAALKSLDSVKFIPEAGHERLKSFVRNRSEWCVSRQRAWGVPIPALYSTVDGKAILTGDSVDHVISEIRDRGVTAWWADPKDDPRWIAPSVSLAYDTSQLRRGTDTMDVWFDSGTSWTQSSKASDEIVCPPADVYLEGTDQHRGWFQSSLLTYIAQQLAANPKNSAPEAPFKTLITHGFVLDSAGLKMSKSIGNVTSPNEIIGDTLLSPKKKKRLDVMGPDALRLWVASSDYTSDVRVNREVLRSINTTLAKYRVTFKFILGVLKDFKGPLDVPLLTLRSPHRIAILQLRRAFGNVRNYYSKRDYDKAIAEINGYITRDLSAFYVESVKDVLYTDRGNARWQAQLTLLVIYQCLQTMLAPVCPLLIEETWDYSTDYIKKTFRHPLETTWAAQEKDLEPFDDPQLAADMLILNQARFSINRAQERARGDKNMGSSLECFALLQIEKLGDGVQTTADCLQRHLTDLAAMFVVSRVDVYVGAPPLRVSNEWVVSEGFEVQGTKVITHVYKAWKAKCMRCWRYLAPVEVEAEEALCDRCESIVDDMRHSYPDLFEPLEDEEIPKYRSDKGL
ncbi:MAG: hypothetical protein LQ343_001324 [Gyalolechia ehrenbergii]|nr:MAG: hypothetical protein LQ343_001324 [Gyalolechia ehrenbergii]